MNLLGTHWKTDINSRTKDLINRLLSNTALSEKDKALLIAAFCDPSADFMAEYLSSISHNNSINYYESFRKNGDFRADMAREATKEDEDQENESEQDSSFA